MALKFLLEKFSNPNSVMRHVSLIAGGTVIAQGITVATMPILSRIYSPADFGTMAVFASVVAILSELSGFRYYLAIPLPKNGRYAEALVALSLGLQVLFVLMLSLAFFFWGEQVFAWFAMGDLLRYRWLLLLGLLGIGFYVTLTQWAIREKLFSTIGKTKISQCISGALVKITLGFCGFKPLGLLLGTVLAQAGGIITLIRSLLRAKGPIRFNGEDIRRVALRYRKFPMFGTWMGLLNTAGAQIIPLLLVGFYDRQVAGFFSMAQNLLLIPSIFVGQAIGQVFLQRASVAYYDGTIKDMSLRSFLLLLRVGFFPIMLISFFAPQLFVVFLGENWHEAGKYALALAPWIALVFASSPLSRLHSILDLQGAGLIFESVYITGRIAGFLLGVCLRNPILSTALFSVVGFLVSFVRTTYLLIKAGNSFFDILTPTLQVFGEALLFLSLPVALSLWKVHPVILCGTVIFSFLAYVVRNYKAIFP